MDVDTIKNLADLARLDPNEEEIQGLLHDIPAILEYVGALRDVAAPEEIGWHGHVLNQTNPDQVEIFEDVDGLVELSAKTNGRFIEVPKIMQTGDE